MKEKQKHLLYWINSLSNKELKKMTADFSVKNLDKKQMRIIIEMVWINLGKTWGTTKEIGDAMHEIFVLMTLELLRRMKGLKRNRDGSYMRTKIGDEVLKRISHNKRYTNSGGRRG